jgi:hypothetical protein
MHPWEWLASPDGHAFAYAVIGLLNAVTIAITLHNNRQISEAKRRLNGHLAQHFAEHRLRHTTSSGLPDQPNPE